jgi:imidazolonepropionase
MRELHIVNDGALLVHNGIIQESGTTQRIENLQKARGAREIDALGRVVMPAFIDPDAVLVAPPLQISRTTGEARELRLSVLSKRRLELAASAAAAAWARCGVLSAGAHSGYAQDLRETVKILRIHQLLQTKPLRIRSIFSPRHIADSDVLIEKWLPAIRKRSLAPVLELTVGAEGGRTIAELRSIAMAAAGLGYSLRIRAARLDDEIHDLAVEAGAVAIVSASPPSAEQIRRQTAAGCIHVMPGMVAGEDGASARQVRVGLDAGAALALASSYRSAGASSFNPQFLLYVAKERLGLTDEEAIVASTWNAACSLRMSHVTGSLEPGKTADFVLMDVSDYRDLARRPGHSDVQLTVRAGQTIYRRGGLILD